MSGDVIRIAAALLTFFLICDTHSAAIPEPADSLLLIPHLAAIWLIWSKRPFASGTRSLAMAIADSKAFSIACGGDTIAAINHFGIADRISYISTAGGAFLEFLEGKTLPAIAALEQRASP